MMLLRLFYEFFKVGLFAIGGGMATFPFLTDLAAKTGWYTQAQLVDMVAIAESTPGPIGVNTATYVGFTVAGIPGACLTVLGSILPPLVIISIISLFYAAFRDNPIVNRAMNGMLAGVAAVIIDVVYTMGRAIVKLRRLLPVLVMLLSFAAVRFLNVNLLVIILVCGVIGAADTLWQQKRREAQAK